MPAFLIPLLKMIASMGGGMAAQKAFASLLAKRAATGTMAKVGATKILPNIPYVLPGGATLGGAGNIAGNIGAFSAGMVGTEAAWDTAASSLGGGDNYEQMDAIESQPYRGDMGLARQEGVMGKVAEEAALKNALQSMFGVDNMDDLMLLMQQQQGAGGLI